MASAPIAASGAANPLDLQASAMGMQDFLKILLTQLSYQDPLKPMDNQEFLAQMAQFTALAQSQQLNARIDQLLSTQASAQALGLLGRTVDISGDGGVISGSVIALAMTGATPLLSVRTTAGVEQSGISLSQVLGVR